jgi:xanthine/uracil permease
MTDFFSGNLFDLAIYVCLFVAVVMGFMTGLLRGLAAIFGYVCGMGVAVVARAEADVAACELYEIRTATDVDRADRNLRRDRSRDWCTSSTGRG